MGVELNIPDEVFVRAFKAAKADDAVAMGASMGSGVFRVLPDIVQVAIRTAAPLIVAAELARLLDAARPDEETLSVLVEGRASELRGEV